MLQPAVPMMSGVWGLAVGMMGERGLGETAPRGLDAKNPAEAGFLKWLLGDEEKVGPGLRRGNANPKLAMLANDLSWLRG